MKKASKRIISVFLTLLMIVTSVPALSLVSFAAIPDELDADKANVSHFGLTIDEESETGYSISTGSSPWDANDEPGNDSNAKNNIVRTWDTVTYETEFITTLYPQGQAEKIYSCPICKGSYIEEVSGPGHYYGSAKSNGDGTHTKTCFRDNSHTVTEACAYNPKVTAPTCTKGGYTKFTCVSCGDSYIKDEKAPKGHSFEGPVWVWDGISAARAVFTCKVCGFFEKADAEITSSVTEAPECVADGVRTYTATAQYNGTTYTDTKTAAEDMTGHSFTSYTYNNDATCVADGTETAACDDCGVANHTRVKEGSKLDHSYVGQLKMNGDFTHSYRCVNGCGKYGATVDCEFSSEVTTAPTCTTKGETTYTCTTCSFQYFEDIAALGHDYVATVTAPTCLADGFTTNVCSRCDDTYVDAQVDALGHSFTNYVSNGDATCLEDGTKTAVCDRCDATDTVTDEGSALGHSFTNYVSNSDATCLDDGTETAKCDRCVVTDTRTEAESVLGHDYVATVTAPTCLAEGFTTNVCSRCSDTYIDAVVPALGHSFTSYASNSDATCLEDGTKTATCDRCDATNTVTDEGSALGHSFTNYVSNEDATCLVDGTKTAKCDRCDVTDTAVDEGSALGHSFTNYVTNNDSTCLEDGTKTAKCDRCDVTDTKGDEGTKKGHSFTNYVSNNDATCLLDGTKTAKCDRCDVTDTKTDADSALGHSFTSYASNNDATCTADGTKTAKCDRCDVTDTVADEGSALGHSFTSYASNNDATCLEDGTKTAKCDRCDVTDTKADEGSALGHSFTSYASNNNATCTADGTKTAKCDRCDVTDTKTDEGSALGHSFTSYASNNDATCTADGTKTAKCDKCDVTDTKADEGTALGHSFTSYASNNNATCTADGAKTAKCDRCDETDTKTDEGSALGHSFANYVSNNNATCTADGTKTAKCDRCDETDTKADEGSALGHSFANYVSNNNATCTADGTKTAKCDKCDVTDTKADEGSALGHTEVTIPVVAPTCTEVGYTEGKKCSVCGAVTEAPHAIAPIDHNFFYVPEYTPGDYDAEKTYGHYQICDACGYREIASCAFAANGFDGIYNYSCTKCNGSVLSDIELVFPSTYMVAPADHTHEFTNYIVVNDAVEAGCTTEGKLATKIATCDVEGCDATDVIAGTTISPLGHSFGEYTYDNNATCTQDGTKTATCSVCHATDTVKDKGTKVAHIPVTDEAAAPTCTESGLTEGSHCIACDYVIEAQNVVAETGHDYTGKYRFSKTNHNHVIQCLNCGAYGDPSNCDFTETLNYNIDDLGEDEYNFGYKTGTVYFEYILPVSSASAVYDVDSMGWLITKPDAIYEIVETTYNGSPAQILHGSYTLTPNASMDSAVGNSYNTLNVSIRVQDMHNGEVLQPMFSMWLGHNDLDMQYKDKKGKIVENGGIPTEIAYGSEYNCPEHDRNELHSFIAPPVYISAAPRYNVKLAKATHPNNSLIGDFDFSTGNETAPNKDLGTINGRLYGYGLTLQLYGESEAKGMRGMEMPDGNPITFDLELSTTYGSTVVSEGYQAKLWSADQNMPGVNSDGRPLDCATQQVYYAAPYNKISGTTYDRDKNYTYCKNGGDWKFEVDETDPRIVHVTVSNYDVDLSALPHTDAGYEITSSRYFNYKNIGKDYYNIQKACISSGELWLVQPYVDPDTGVHIKDAYNIGGNLHTTIKDSNLVMRGTSGTNVSPQAVVTDDIATFDYLFVRPGNRTSIIWYSRYNSPSTELTYDCKTSNADWAVEGQKIAIYSYTNTQEGEKDSVPVVMANVIKFDNSMFDPESSSIVPREIEGTYSYNRYVRWGAKADKTGWDHKGLKPDQEGYDEQMFAYTAEDLVWFDSLDELKASGYVPVAVAYQQVGLTKTATTGGSVSASQYVRGMVKHDCEIHYAYTTLEEGYIWEKGDIATKVCDYYGIEYDAQGSMTNKEYREYLASLPTDTQFTDYAKKFFSFDLAANLEDYAPSYIHNTKHTAGYSNKSTVSKAQYDEGYNYIGGNGAYHYTDDCFIIPFESKITKAIAQTNSDGTMKKIFDMDLNQRVVDYRLNMRIEHVGGDSTSSIDEPVVTTVKVTDTLPKGLTYIVGSAYYDKDLSATYTQHPNQQVPGTITGAELKAPKVTANADGTTTLEWTFKEVVVDPNDFVTDLGNIYFSAKIGTPENPNTDVRNQQQLINSCTIVAGGDTNREFKEEFGNYAEVSLEVLMLSGLSIVKVPDSDVIDKGQLLGYNISVANNSARKSLNTIIVEELPHNGDRFGSKFHGERYVTKFAAIDNDPDLYRSFEYFYTTNSKYADEDSWQFKDEGYNQKVFEESPDWIKLELSDGDLRKGMFKNLPTEEEQKGNQIVEIVACGDFPGGKTLKFRIEIDAPDTQAKDKLINAVSRDRLLSLGQTMIVDRAIGGEAFVDKNGDGTRDENEPLRSDVTITLMKKEDDGTLTPVTYIDEDGNEQPVVIKTGQSIDITTGKIVDAKDEGSYRFTGVPEGTFVIVFDGGNKSEEIVMPPARELKNKEIYEVGGVNTPLTQTAVETTITWDDMNDLDELRTQFGITLYANGKPVSEEVFSDGANELTYKWDELPFCENGEIIEYKVVVTTLPKGYEPIYNNVNYDIVLQHIPVTPYVPVVFFAPDNMGYKLADGIHYYTTIDGKDERVSKGTYFHDSTTIYVLRGTEVKFTPYFFFTSYGDEYCITVRSGKNDSAAFPTAVMADEEGYFEFRVINAYNFIMLQPVVTDPVTNEKKPWYQFLLDFFAKIKELFQKLFGGK